MFERFTERARQVVVLAQDEARGLKHGYIGTEHMLLGLLREEEDIAARVLESVGVELEEVRAHVVRIVGEGEDVPTGQIPFTPRSKKVLDLSLREALALRHDWIGTEHVLLGLVRENDGVAARILLDLGADAERIRNETLSVIAGAQPERSAAVTQELSPERVADVARRRRVTPARPRRGRRRAAIPMYLQTALALVVAAVGFPLGLLVGWLIWG